MTKTEGKVYDAVKTILQAKGFDTAMLQIVSFGRGTHHDILLDGEHIGSYEHRGERLTLFGGVK